MHITKATIKNYRTLRDISIEFNAEKNIIVGPNEAGKSTLLEAISLALAGQLNGRSIFYELHPYLFNQNTVQTYIEVLRSGQSPEPPFFEIELFLENTNDLAALKGTNNSLRENVPGIVLRAELNEQFSDEYQAFIADPAQISNIPIEYYRVVWTTFAGKALSPRSRPIKSSMIDTGDLRQANGPNKYIIETVSDFLAPAERAHMSLSYRKMKDVFVGEAGIQAINAKLLEKRGEISEKTLSVSLDTTAKGSWESGIITNLDNIPFSLVGKGEQNSVKVQLAMDAASDCQIILVEEPENHLSFTNLNKLISRIHDRVNGRQLFITTHSNFVLNKLDVGNVLLLRENGYMRLNDLDEETRDYFLKLPGHDTLRLILASGRVLLVEGPSDELIVQKAYAQTHEGRMPLEDGIEVISVKSLAFKRFLRISEKLDIETHVITDNDGNIEALQEKYADFDECENVHVHYDNDTDYPTLEPQLLKSNSRATLNSILEKDFDTDEALLNYMTSSNNKTECALKIFNSNQDFVVPQYIQDAFA